MLSNLLMEVKLAQWSREPRYGSKALLFAHLNKVQTYLLNKRTSNTINTNSILEMNSNQPHGTLALFTLNLQVCFHPFCENKQILGMMDQNG